MPIPTNEAVTRRIGESWESVVDRIIKFIIDNMSQLILPSSKIVLVNGDNNNIDLKEVLFVTVTGPTAAYAITGVGGGSGGKIVIIRNGTNEVLTFRNNSGSSALDNGILTGTGADVVGNIALLIYDESVVPIKRWIMVSLR